MIHVIQIHWKRKVHNPDKPDTGKTTYYARSKYLAGAITKSRRKFLQQYGNHLLITCAGEFSDPAGII